jgi:hypothetical protein
VYYNPGTGRPVNPEGIRVREQFAVLYDHSLDAYLSRGWSGRVPAGMTFKIVDETPTSLATAASAGDILIYGQSLPSYAQF